jgi:alpha-D-xyloside xylohydrolase
VAVTTPEGEVAEYTVTRSGTSLSATGPDGFGFTLRDAVTGRTAEAESGRASLS